MQVRALVSVSDKANLDFFAKSLHSLNIGIIATGGTAKAIEKFKIPVTKVEDMTGFPELLDGRVKTLHPAIHAGILAPLGASELKAHMIEPIDIVAVNLYPFEQVSADPKSTVKQAVENIDIGGVALLRSAAKNYGRVTAICDPSQYKAVVEELKANGSTSLKTRQRLASAAFSHVSYYDALISNYFAGFSDEDYPELLTIALRRRVVCRYGENPHLTGSIYSLAGNKSTDLTAAEQLSGKQMSLNNYLDSNAAISVILEFDKPAAAIVKHTNPSGVAIGDSVADALKKAYDGDSISAFGGIIALNRQCDEEAAKFICSFFNEIVVAPSYTPQAIELLKKSQSRRMLKVDLKGFDSQRNYSKVLGGLLVHQHDGYAMKISDLKVVTKAKPSKPELEDLLFAWKVGKYVKSNSVVIANGLKTLAIGSGFTSRIDAVRFACSKAGERSNGSVLASDGFFPFSDSIKMAANAKISAIIQPGGSLRDKEVIEEADGHGIAMVFTGRRAFRH